MVYNKEEINKKRREKYNNDEEYRIKKLEKLKKYREEHKEEISKKNKEKYLLNHPKKPKKMKLFIYDDRFRYYYYEDKKQIKKEIMTVKDINKSIEKINNLPYFKPDEIINNTSLNFVLDNGKLKLNT